MPNAPAVTREMMLVHAAYAARLDVLKKCLTVWGVHVDATYQGVSALVQATLHGHVDVVKQLLAAGAQVDFRCKDDLTALHFLLNEEEHFLGPVAPKRLQILHILLKAKADVNSICGGLGLLHRCALWGDGLPNRADFWRLLADEQADINLRNEDGVTPLHVACRRHNEGMIQFLLAKDASPNISTWNGETALIAAVLGRRDVLDQWDDEFEWIAEALVEKRADVNLVGAESETALHISCKCGYVGATKLLLQLSADPDVLNEHKQLPVEMAISHGHCSLVRVFNALGEGHQSVSYEKMRQVMIWAGCWSGIPDSVFQAHMENVRKSAHQLGIEPVDADWALAHAAQQTRNFQLKKINESTSGNAGVRGSRMGHRTGLLPGMIDAMGGAKNDIRGLEMFAEQARRQSIEAQRPGAPDDWRRASMPGLGETSPPRSPGGAGANPSLLPPLEEPGEIPGSPTKNSPRASPRGSPGASPRTNAAARRASCET